MRSVGLVTSSRSDWGIQRPVAEALRARDDVALHIIAAGAHLVPELGNTAREITADGFEVARRVAFLEPEDSPESVARSMGRGVQAFASLFAEWRPDILTVLGDRFDMFPAAVAATVMLIPVAHLHGGELTRGALDDALRHALTKMSHIHLASTEEYARRIRQMGEDPAHVHVVGAPALDDLLKLEPLSGAVLEAECGFNDSRPNVLVAYYAETRAYQDVPHAVSQVLAALDGLEANLVIIRPIADTANSDIRKAIDGFCAGHRTARAPQNLPRRTFLSLMRAASVMVGNSSAGILEAPSFKLPVVNIGLRQAGRMRAGNVIDCACDTPAIDAALQKALSPEFRESLSDLKTPFGDGRSAPPIARILATTPLDAELIRKPFFDVPANPQSDASCSMF